jgi:hypothetical protein
LTDSKPGGFKEHGVMMYLSKDLYRGFIKLQGDKDLGRAYAALLPFTEGLYRLGYIPKEVYEAHVKKYSQSLYEAEKEKPKNPALEQKEKQLLGMLEEWNLPHPKENWREQVIGEAKKYPDLEASKKILELAQQQTCSSEEVASK